MAANDVLTGDILKQAIDGIGASAEERGKLQLQMATTVLDLHKAQMSAQTSIMLADAKGKGALQRSWRPIINLAFGWIIFYQFFVREVLNVLTGAGLPPIDIPVQLWTIIMVFMGVTTGGRSLEKTINAAGSINLFTGAKIDKRDAKMRAKVYKDAMEEAMKQRPIDKELIALLERRLGKIILPQKEGRN